MACDWDFFIPLALVYFLSAIETSGDLTANNLFCNQPINGPLYIQRIKGGILADGFNSMLAVIVTCGAQCVEKLMIAGRWLIEDGKHITFINQQVMQQHHVLAKE